MRLLQNPIFLRALITFAMICFIAIIGVVLIRRMRKEVSEDTEPKRVDGQSTGFSLAAYEGVITRLKEQERELQSLRKSESDRARESATVNEAIVSNLPSGVVLFSSAGLVRQANPAARTLLGYASPTGLHARDIFKAVSWVQLNDNGATKRDSGAQPLVSAIEQSISAGGLFRRVEAGFETPGGIKRVLGITISSVRSAKDETLGAVCLLTDLTDITRLSEQVKLKENMAALGEMSAGIAHEFKNSLATISGYAQMLARENTDSDGFAKSIVSETANLSRIVSDFLNFAKPQGSAREHVDLLTMATDCAREANVNVKVSQQGEDVAIDGDATALRQAIMNLLRNSAEAAKADLEVIVNARATADHVNLSLIDNAGGIAKEDLSKIFIPFFTTKSSGTGLGLALVHRIVTDHGGTIEVESPVPFPPGGVGTAFTLTFPRSTSSYKVGESASQRG
jgi:signal transduction histidine kinase